MLPLIYEWAAQGLWLGVGCDRLGGVMPPPVDTHLSLEDFFSWEMNKPLLETKTIKLKLWSNWKCKIWDLKFFLITQSF